MPDITWNEEDLKRNRDNSGIKTGINTSSIRQGYQHGSLTKGLVAYYPMEKGEGEVLFDGARGNHGQIKGASWNGTGQVGSESLSFDGGSDYIDIPDFSKFSQYSISAWINADTLSIGEQDVVTLYGGNEVSIVVDHGGAPDKISIQQNDSGTWYRASSKNKIDVGTWYHVVGWWNGATMRLFVDGVKQSETSVSGMDSYGGVTELGGRTASDLMFSGSLDDVRIYNRVLSRPEIEALYNLTSPSGRKITESDVPTQIDSGISRWNFNGDVTDSWGSNDGTDNTSAGYTTGVYGQAKAFDGNGHVDFGDIGTDSITVSLWICAGAQDNSGIIAKEDSGTEVFSLRTETGATTNDGIRLFVTDTSDSRVADLYHDGVLFGEWVQTAFTYNPSAGTKLYVNGAVVDSASPTGNALNKNDFPVEVGRYNQDDNLRFSGDIDDVRIYDRALSPVEVEQLYNLGAYRINRGDVLQ